MAKRSQYILEPIVAPAIPAPGSHKFIRRNANNYNWELASGSSISGFLNVIDFGASSSTATAIGTTSGNLLTLDDASTFEKDQYVIIYGGGTSHSMGTAPTPTVVVNGTTGGTTISYYIIWTDGDAGASAISAAQTINNSQSKASRNSTNFNRVTVTLPGTGIPRTAHIIRSENSSVEYVGRVVSARDTTGLYVDDIGQTGDAPENLPEDPVTSAFTGLNRLTRKRITKKNENVLTLDSAVDTDASNLLVIHDNALAFKNTIETAQTEGKGVFVPSGKWRVTTGSPTNDDVWDTDGYVHDLWRVNVDGFTFIGDNAELIFNANYISQFEQADNPTEVTNIFRLAGPSNAIISRVKLSGFYARWDRDTSTSFVSNGAQLTWNTFYLIRTEAVNSLFENIRVNRFPHFTQEGAVLGDDEAGATARLSFNVYRNINVESFGGGAMDHLAYLQGGVEWDGGTIAGNELWKAHIWYFGLDRPGVRIRNVYMRSMRFLSDGVTPSNGGGISFRGEEGISGRDVIFDGCFFEDVGDVLLGFTTGAAYQDVMVSNCQFNNTTIRARNVERLSIDGCIMENNSLLFISGCKDVVVDIIHDGSTTCELRYLPFINADNERVIIKGNYGSKWLVQSGIDVIFSGCNISDKGASDTPMIDMVLETNAIVDDIKIIGCNINKKTGHNHISIGSGIGDVDVISCKMNGTGSPDGYWGFIDMRSSNKLRVKGSRFYEANTENTASIRNIVEINDIFSADVHIIDCEIEREENNLVGIVDGIDSAVDDVILNNNIVNGALFVPDPGPDLNIFVEQLELNNGVQSDLLSTDTLSDGNSYIYDLTLAGHNADGHRYTGSWRSVIRVMNGLTDLVSLSAIHEDGTGWTLDGYDNEHFAGFFVTNNSGSDGTFSLFGKTPDKQFVMPFKWTPSLLSQAVSWYEPNDLTSLTQPSPGNGNDITVMANKILGNTTWDLNSILGTHPKRIDGGSENGNRVVRSNGNSVMRSTGATQNQPVHIFMRAKSNAVISGAGFFHDAASSFYRTAVGHNGSNDDWHIRGDGGVIQLTEADTGLTSFDTWRTIESYWDDTTSYVKIDGVTVLSGDFGSGPPGGITIFGRQDGTARLNVDVAALVVCDSELTGEDLSNMRQYMRIV